MINFGMLPEIFQRDYSGRKPLCFRKAHDVSEFSWGDANGIFERCDVGSDSFKMTMGRVIEKTNYVERYYDVGTVRYRLVKAMVYELMLNGATMIANRVKSEPLIEHLATQVASFTGQQVVSSAYAAFGSRDSFRAHWDTRDVFAIQMLGRKRWLISQPSFEKPLYTQQSKDFEESYPMPEEVYMDVVLEAGDVLYVPRGWWHNPTPMGEPTCHFSFGTFPPLGIDYLIWAANEAQQMLPIREALGPWERSAETVCSIARDMAEFLAQSENYRRFLDDYYASIRQDTFLSLDILGNPNSLGFDDEQRFRLACHNLHGLTEGFVIANGVKLNLDGMAMQLIERIAREPGISMYELLFPYSEPEQIRIRTLLAELCRQDVLNPMFGRF